MIELFNAIHEFINLSEEELDMVGEIMGLRQKGFDLKSDVDEIMGRFVNECAIGYGTPQRRQIQLMYICRFNEGSIRKAMIKMLDK